MRLTGLVPASASWATSQPASPALLSAWMSSHQACWLRPSFQAPRGQEAWGISLPVAGHMLLLGKVAALRTLTPVSQVKNLLQSSTLGNSCMHGWVHTAALQVGSAACSL